MLRKSWLLIRRHPEFGKLWAGDLISVLGSGVTTVALPLTAVVVLHADAPQMGLLSALGTLPPLLFGLVAGVWIDRFPRRTILIVSDAGRALLLGSVPALAVLGWLRMELLYPIQFLVGLLSFLFLVTSASLVPALVDREDLMQANSATSLNSSLGATVGPALAGALVRALTAPVVIAFDAASFVLSAFCTILIRTPPAPGPSPVRIRFGPEVLEGLRLLFTGRYLSPIAVSALVGSLGGAMQGALVVLFLVRGLHLTATLVGLAATCVGLGSVAGSIMAPELASRLGPGRVYLLGQLLAAVPGLVLVAVQGPTIVVLALVAVAQALGGAAAPLYRTSQRTIRQTLVPERVLGRVNSSWQFVVIGIQPLGALLGGLIAALAGLRAAIAVSSLVILLAWVWAVRSPLRQVREEVIAH